MERALLVAIEFDYRTGRRSAAVGDGTGSAIGSTAGHPRRLREWLLEDELNELQELVRSAGCQLAGEVLARRHTPVAATLIG